eukprot:COSAG05_NODE_2249_length_3338_cov_15.138932_3_plen_71_part_00
MAGVQWRHTKLASASTKGTLRAWNAVAGVQQAPPSAYERNRYLAGRGTYGGSECLPFPDSVLQIMRLRAL